MSYDGPDLMERKCTYLVLITEALVAHDIAQTIEDFDPASEVICALSIAEAEAALLRAESVEIAFVAGIPTAFVGSALHGSIVERGGRVVLLGMEAEAAGPTTFYDVLPQPFDTDAVLATVLKGLPGYT